MRHGLVGQFVFSGWQLLDEVTIDNLSTPRRVLFLAGGDGIEGNIYHAKIAVLTSNQQAKTECYPFVIIGDC